MTDHLHLFSSLSPNPNRAARQLECFESWVERGALVHLIQRVRDAKSIDEDILANVYAYHEIDGTGPIPFVEILLHASTIDGHVLILNGDNELIVSTEYFSRFGAFVGDGLMVLPRAERYVAERTVENEPYDPFERLERRGYERQGIEGIYLRVTAGLIKYCQKSPRSFCMGEPWWDVIIPHYYVDKSGVAAGDLCAPAAPVATHEPHERMWDVRLCHTNGVVASCVMGIPTRNSVDELNKLHESASFVIRKAITFIGGAMLAGIEKLPESSYPVLTSAQMSDLLALEQASTALGTEPVDDFVKTGTETVLSVAESVQRIEPEPRPRRPKMSASTVPTASHHNKKRKGKRNGNS